MIKHGHIDHRSLSISRANIIDYRSLSSYLFVPFSDCRSGFNGFFKLNVPTNGPSSQGSQADDDVGGQTQVFAKQLEIEGCRGV